MKKICALITACALIAAPMISLAEPPPPIECAESWPTRCSTPIDLGEKARFAGQLVSPDLAIYLAQSINGMDARIKAVVTASTAAVEAARDRDKKIWAANLRAAETERDAYKKASSRPLLESPLVVSLTTAVVIIGVLFAAKAARE